MGTSLRVLLVEDSEDDAALVVRELTLAGYSVTFQRVDTADALLTSMEQGKWDAVISDYTMPGFSGAAALALVRQYDTEMPFIFASGTIGEDAAVAAMRTGAHDYVMKGNLKRLVPAIERELREVIVRRSRKRVEERLVHLAHHDALTDLPNRFLLQDRLQQAVLGAQRSGETVALLILDLDGFKAINDSLGHYAGDCVLQQVASRLRDHARASDTVSRLGGDEFAFVLPRTDGPGAMIAARKIVQALKQPILFSTCSFVVKASIGIAWSPEHGTTAEVLLQKADIAMYAAKTGGLECALYEAERDFQAHHRLGLMTELREGIEKDHFVNEYQPIIDLQSGAAIGVEALARWRHPRQGLLPPSEFIDLAEQTGLIEPLTMLMIDKALADWNESYARFGIRMSVNLSVRNLQDPAFPDRIADLLRIRGVAPSMLGMEITENFVMSDPIRAAKCLSRLHEMGTKLVIDDFGTGYCSLSYLQRLPVDELKIDRSFLVAMTRGDEAIVRCAIDLAHNLGLKVIAEGVESLSVRDRLCELGCEAAQGFLFAPARPAVETRRWIGRQQSSRADRAG